MKFTKVLACAVVAFASLSATRVALAQDKFPLRQGEWTLTAPDPTNPKNPMVFNLCMNDETWSKSLTSSPICVASNVTRTVTGLTYSLTCNTKTFQMAGTGTWTFDGMEHFIAKSITTITMNGKPTTSTSITDFRWKGAECSPNDLNLRKRPAH